MNIHKQNLSKTELLTWANQTINDDKLIHSKIQQFGNGVGYLYILQHYHPGIVNLTKIYPKAQGQYQSLHNLKILASCLSNLRTTHPYDNNKICRMKFQDNFNMLQWLYHFTSNNKAIKKIEDNTLKQSRSKKISIVPVEKRTTIFSDKKLKKIDSDDQFCFQAKKINTPAKKLNDIDEIIHNENQYNDQMKLQKIREILFQKKNSQIPSSMVQQDRQDTENNNSYLNFSIPTKSNLNKHTSSNTSEVSNHHIPVKYQNQLKSKSSMEQQDPIINQQQLKVKQDKNNINPFLKSTVRQSILKRYSHDNTNRSFKQESKNRVSISNQTNVFLYPEQRANEERLTDNSDLLRSSGRKSMDNIDNLLLQK